MSFNGNGVFLINTPGQPVVSGTTITSTAFNALTTDLASGLTNTITKDGQTNITANIPMSNFKITGLGAGTNPNDAVRLAQIQDGIINGRFVNLEYSGTFTGSTGVVNIGSGQIYKQVGGNVGINTTTPSEKLTVIGNIVGSNYYIPAAGAGTYGLADLSAAMQTFSAATSPSNIIKFITATAERVRIDSSGNVGINTPAPASTLQVVGTTRLGASASDAVNATASIYSDGTGISIESYQGDNSSVKRDLWVAAYGGNVGIGTQVPIAKLDVANGVVAIRSTALFNTSSTIGSGSSAYIRSANAFSSATLPDYTWWQNDQCGLFHPAVNVIGFTINGTERMRLDASGNLSVNNSAIIGNATIIGKFNVQSDNAATAIVTGNVSGAAAYNGALFYNNGFTSLVGQISIAGSTASYLSVSDYRLKDDVAPMTGALATVAQLKPVTYKWKADGSDGQGFIAHELQTVVPDCVTGDKDAVDDEGKPKYQGVDTSFLVATLTAALQESHQLIKDLQVRVAALEA
jgi:hypothetical protein